jgi:hypothetical protein
MRRGHMDIVFIHVNLIDARVPGIQAIVLYNLVDNIASWRR